MIFTINKSSYKSYPRNLRECVLVIDNWNDYKYETLFHLHAYDEYGNHFDIGTTKIGFFGQSVENKTRDFLPSYFEFLPPNFFSLGDGVEFYKNIIKLLPTDFSLEILRALNDISYMNCNFDKLSEEPVFYISLLRNVELSTINGQFKRVIDGKDVLTDYKFSFKRSENKHFGNMLLNFNVMANSTPSTNIHAIIGRNGAGKTTILNGMVEAITQDDNNLGFYTPNFFSEGKIPDGYFSSLISISFSAFDPFVPPKDQPDPTKGICYYYIGLKNSSSDQTSSLANLDLMRDDFSDAFETCLSNGMKTSLLLDSLQTLSSDPSFEVERYKNAILNGNSTKKTNYSHLVSNLSSGHFLVIYLTTKLISKVAEKTLVLIDEPESHLHPPLLSSFIRVLSDILSARNGVSIIATHSPVVLQELPSSCVNRIYRVGKESIISKPKIQTFGENIGTITRDVFGLEVSKSGFHSLLERSVQSGRSFEEIMQSFNHELGHEAQGILRTMIMFRDMDGKL